MSPRAGEQRGESGPAPGDKATGDDAGGAPARSVRSGHDRGRAARMAEQLHERRERHHQRGRAYRAAITVTGFLVVLGGIVLAAPGVPGPGFLVVLIGLAILALEFDWAERSLWRGLDYAEQAGERAAAMSTRRKTVTTILTFAGVGAVIAAVFVFDVPIPFVRG